MDALTLLMTVSRLLLAGVLLLAAGGKLLHHQPYRQTLADFGVPAPLRAPLAWAMPLGELVIGLALALTPGRATWWAASAAAALLALYTGVLAYQLLRGRRPHCNCFGQTEPAPIGPSTLLRNAALLLAAVGVAAAGPAYPHASLWPHVADAPALTACLVIMALQWWLLYHALRQNGRLILRIDALELRLDAAHVQPLHAPGQAPRGLAVGSLAPEFSLAEAGGGHTVTLARLRAAGLPVLLIFSDVACKPCMELAAQIDGWHRQYQDRLTIAVILRVEAEQLQRPRPAHACTTLPQASRAVAASYDALVTPSAVLVSAEGTIASHLALGAKEIYDLLQSTLPQIYETSEIAA